MPEDFIRNAHANNDHGCGFAYAKDGKLFIEKGAYWKADEMVKRLALLTDYPTIIHFRLATHGGTNHLNTHPFAVGVQRWACAHNGVISGIKMIPGESDTRAFIRQCVVPNIEHIKNAEFKQEAETFLGKGNKFVFLNTDGEHVILNEEQGEWKDGIWYSNDSYEDEPLSRASWYSKPSDKKYYYRYKLTDMECASPTCKHPLFYDDEIVFSTVTGSIYCGSCGKAYE